MVMGSPGKVVRTLDKEQGAAIRMGAKHYVQNAKRFRDQLVIQVTADLIKSFFYLIYCHKGAVLSPTIRVECICKGIGALTSGVQCFNCPGEKRL